jgi:hypothetical protein
MNVTFVYNMSMYGYPKTNYYLEKLALHSSLGEHPSVSPWHYAVELEN